MYKNYEARIAVITVVSGFDIQMRLVGHSALYRMVLTHEPHLRAFLNKRKLDRRLKGNKSYSNHQRHNSLLYLGHA